MKFRTLILASLIALIFSACAGPATNMDVDGSSGVGEDGINIGDLIGGLGGDDITDDDGVIDTDATKNDDDTSSHHCSRYAQWSDSDKACVCEKYYFMDKNGLCKRGATETEINIGGMGRGSIGTKQFCVDPNAEMVTKSNPDMKGGKYSPTCECKTGYFKGNEGTCIAFISFPTVDAGIASKTIYVKNPVRRIGNFTIGIKTADRKNAGTKANIRFHATGKGGVDLHAATQTLNDLNDNNDFRQGYDSTYIFDVGGNINPDDITGFKLRHDGNGDGWFIQSIYISAKIVDGDGNYVTIKEFYYNPAVLKWIDDESIAFNLNDVAVFGWVITDRTDNGNNEDPSTDNDVFLDINIADAGSDSWGEFHDSDMGPHMESGSDGLEFLLDWNKYDDHQNYWLYRYYTDFVSLKDIDLLDVDSANLRLEDEGKDAWRPDSFKFYVFKPAKIGSRKRGERACWLIESKDDHSGTILEPGDEGFKSFPKMSDCDNEIRGISIKSNHL